MLDLCWCSRLAVSSASHIVCNIMNAGRQRLVAVCMRVAYRTAAAASTFAVVGTTALSNSAACEQEQGSNNNNNTSENSGIEKPTKPDIITENKDYIKGIKIYGIGILEDPVPGEKRGRGIQHLTSSYWIYDMGVFINREFRVMQSMVRYAYERSQIYPFYDYRYFTNISNALFLKAEAEGLMTEDGRDFFLMACWCAMAAAEVDGFQYAKYSPEQRAKQREAFYHKYLQPDVVWVEGEEDDPKFEAKLGKYAIEGCRIDLLPSVALERLGIHNELCALKWEKPTTWLREGFPISSRIDSMKRHYESIHARDSSEDHIAHLIWGFMAVTHVVACFPQMNDLTNFENVRRRNVLTMDEDIQVLVGDGGFRPARAGQSAHRISLPESEQVPPVTRRTESKHAKARTKKGDTSVAQEAKNLHELYTGDKLE